MIKTARLLKIRLLILSLSIVVLSGSGFGQRVRRVPHVSEKTKPSNKSAEHNESKKNLSEEEIKKQNEEELKSDEEELPDLPNADSAPAQFNNPPVNESLLLLAACLILPLIPAIILLKRTSNNTNNKFKNAVGWSRENKSSISTFYIVGVVLIVFAYTFFFRDYERDHIPNSNAVSTLNDTSNSERLNGNFYRSDSLRPIKAADGHIVGFRKLRKRVDTFPDTMSR